MFRMIGAVLLTFAISLMVFANEQPWPEVHPCTGAKIPLTTEKAVVEAIECLYDGRVAKVIQKNAGRDDWFYQLRILISGGRVKTLDVHPQTGLPLDPKELEAINAAFDY